MALTSFYEIDPDGDIELILSHPAEVVSPLDGVLECPPTPPQLYFRRPITPESSPTAEEVFIRDSDTSTTAEVDALAISKEPTDADLMGSKLPKLDATSTSDENCVRIQVSSKHLTIASSYFKRNLRSGMLESHTLSSQGHVQFPMDEKDLEAMLIVTNIIHGRSRQAPRFVNLDMLTRLAVLVDYLECHEVIEPFSDRWIDDLKKDITVTWSKELIQWLCISLVFRKECQFKAVTRTAIRQAKGPIQTLGLPIRESVVDEINQQRSDTLDRLLSALEDLLDDFRQDRIFCKFECNAMRYGTLAKELGYRELLFPRPRIPFLGYSFENIVASIRKIQDSQWCYRSSRSRSYYDSYSEPHTCKLTSHITPIISSIDDNLKGLSLLDDF